MATQGSGPAPFDPEETIIAPENAWCGRHWAQVREAAAHGANAVYCSMRVITRALEMDRFYELVPDPKEPPQISAALRGVAPVCCFLGDEEVGLMVMEARAINQRPS